MRLRSKLAIGEPVIFHGCGGGNICVSNLDDEIEFRTEDMSMRLNN